MNLGLKLAIVVGLGFVVGAGVVKGGVMLVSSKRWRTRPGVKLAPPSEAWLDAMTEATGVDVEVTSGDRSPSGQIRAMIGKHNNGSSKADFLALYGDDDQIEALWPFIEAGDIAGGAAVLEAHMEQGRYLSRHIARPGHPESWALDIDLSPGPSGKELAALLDFARQTGVRAVNEGNHLHLEVRR
mgnify:CR=1 FL=1